MARKNTTFCSGNPTWAIACVGALSDYWDYSKGFSQAANLLIDKVLQNHNSDYFLDELVYPVCFNMRHSVELRLKGAISELILLEEKRDRRLEFDLAGSHDIGNIWQFFTENSNSADDRYIPINTRLDTKIMDIAEIDATGQTFRYPLDIENRKHLVDVAHINFVNLMKSFSELESVLDELHMLSKYLLDEYSLGTYTTNLSRKNIFEIASLLPSRDKWAETSFETVKSDLKDQFKISGNELSKSIKIIEAHFELAPMIGLSIPLRGVSETDILEFVTHWFKIHVVISVSNSNKPDFDPNEYLLSEETFQSTVTDTEVRQEIWQEVSQKLTPEILAGLAALFYFARNLDFSEQYVHIYEHELRESKTAIQQSENSLKVRFFHIFDKTNGVDKILRSLYFLKKGEIAEKIVSTHGLEEKFSWLDDARNRTLFKKPEYCGYMI